MKRKVVITGLGALTPLGNSVETYWDNLVHGRTGIGRITAFDASLLASQVAGEVKNFEAAPYFRNAKDARRCDRYTQLAVAAAKEAYAHAGLDPANLNAARCGSIIGSSIGGLITLS